MNQMKTFALLAALTALLMMLGALFGGTNGALIALVIAAGINLYSYWNADKIVLRMHDAREVDAATAPEFYGIVQQLSQRAGLPMPKVYVVNQDAPNAFATGRNPENAAVAATTGLLATLDHDEIAAVMAHELGHVKNRDTLIMTVTATIAGAISMIANFGLIFGGRGSDRPNPIAMLLAVFVAPLAAGLVQMAISRTREYSADRAAAELSGQPLALASALAKLANGAAHTVNPVAVRDPAMASLYIVPPHLGSRMDNLFSTHPDTANRIAALEAIAAEMGTLPPPQARAAGPWG
jgi:heat shock protein HtpX